MKWIKQIPIKETGESARGEDDGLGDVVLFDMLFKPESAKDVASMIPLRLRVAVRYSAQRGNSVEDKTSFMLHGFGM